MTGRVLVVPLDMAGEVIGEMEDGYSGDESIDQDMDEEDEDDDEDDQDGEDDDDERLESYHTMWLGPKESAVIPSSNIPNRLIACTSTHHLLLFDERLQELARLPFAVPTALPLVGSLGAVDRLAMVCYSDNFYIPNPICGIVLTPCF